MKQVKYTKNELEKTALNFFKSKNGKNWLIVGVVCFLLGVVWQVVLITIALMGAGYLVYKKQKGGLDFEKSKKKRNLK